MQKKSKQGGNSKVEHFWNTLESVTWLPCWLHKKQSKCYGKEQIVKPVKEIKSISKAVAKPVEELAKPLEELAKSVESAIGGRKKHVKKHTKKHTKNTRKNTPKNIEKNTPKNT